MTTIHKRTTPIRSGRYGDSKRQEQDKEKDRILDDVKDGSGHVLPRAGDVLWLR